MLGISVELGTYSVKFLSYKIDKKSTTLINSDEVVLEYDDDYLNTQVSEDSPVDLVLWNLQFNTIKNYLAQIQVDFQITMEIPSDLVSMRHLTLPVKSKKKAAQMLPFQIEEDLPYPISNCHWAENLTVKGEKTEAIVGLVKKNHFEEFFNNLTQHNINPNILTNDVSVFDSYIKKNASEFPSSFCIINIGHTTTRGFYFHNGTLVSNHTSYVAGRAVTDAISKTYSISLDEATIYKHQNSFLLLEEQFNQVNENQKEFAKVMDSTMAPLLSEIKRWDIGYRVQHGSTINDIYLCGGSSNIKNIENYLASKLNANIHFFDPYQSVDAQQIDQDNRLRRKFSQTTALSSSMTSKSKLINFLKGDYTLSSSSDLPIDSMAFISVRLGVISLITCLFFLIQGFLANRQTQESQRYLSSLYKNTVIKDNISRSIIRRSRRNPQVIINKLNQKNKLIEQEVKVVQSSLQTNAFSSFMGLLNLISGHNIEIIKFVAQEDHNIDFILSSDSLAPLESIERKLKEDKSTKWFLDLNKNKKTLSGGGVIKK